jgi:hypothetical protein
LLHLLDETLVFFQAAFDQKETFAGKVPGQIAGLVFNFQANDPTWRWWRLGVRDEREVKSKKAKGKKEGRSSDREFHAAVLSRVFGFFLFAFLLFTFALP